MVPRHASADSYTTAWLDYQLIVITTTRQHGTFHQHSSTTGPGTYVAGPSDIKLLNRSGPFLVYCSSFNQRMIFLVRACRCFELQCFGRVVCVSRMAFGPIKVLQCLSPKVLFQNWRRKNSVGKMADPGSYSDGDCGAVEADATVSFIMWVLGSHL